MSNYTREEFLVISIKNTKARVKALDMIIERTKDFDCLDGVDYDLHNTLNEELEVIYHRREEIERKLADYLEEQGDLIQAEAEDCNENI